MIPLLYHTCLSIFLTLVSSAEAAVMDSLLAAALAAVLPDENPTLWVSRSKNASIIPSCGTQTHVSHGLLRFSSRYKICIEIHMVVLQLLNSQNPTTMPKELHQPQWPAPHHYSAMKHCVKVVLLLYIPHWWRGSWVPREHPVYVESQHCLPRPTSPALLQSS